MATARVPLSLVAVLVLLSPSPFSASLSLSVSPSRDLSLALSRSPAGVLFVENRDDVLRANLGEGALELSVPGGGRRQLWSRCRSPIRVFDRGIVK